MGSRMPDGIMGDFMDVNIMGDIPSIVWDGGVGKYEKRRGEGQAKVKVKHASKYSSKLNVQDFYRSKRDYYMVRRISH